MRPIFLILLVCAWSGTQLHAQRVTRGLQVLYTFDEGQGEVIHDRSGVGRPLNLRIYKRSAVKWGQGSLIVRSSADIRSPQRGDKISGKIAQGSDITVEAWIQAANDKQKGPARIVSMSDSPNRRNFTLGQQGSQVDFRFRTTRTNRNGFPSFTTKRGAIPPQRMIHVVARRQSSGKMTVFVNGKARGSRRISGTAKNWSKTYALILANERTGNRPWLGTLHLIAIYGRALSGAEITKNFSAGPNFGDAAAAKLVQARARQRLFETKVAPLLARRCLDCHDSATSKGRLDLSQRTLALRGGKSGAAIVAGKLSQSLLWSKVASGAMPKGGKPLTSGERQILRKWIKDGAVWTLNKLDAAVYAHSANQQHNFVRRLTVEEYIATVRGAVGVDVSKEAWRLLPQDLRADGFNNTAYNLTVDLKHVRAYAKLAEIAVGRLDVLKFARRFSRSRSLNTDATLRKFVAAMGKWLLRGPLDDREVTNYSGIATTVASAGGSYKQGVSLILEAMLQSPRFIYLIEDQQGDGTRWPVGQYELASRLSYMMWGAPPDAALIRLADRGQLNDPAKIRAEAKRMLTDPRAIRRSLHFVAQWLHLSRLESLRPDSKRFPAWNGQLAGDMRRETEAFFREVVWQQQRPLTDLFNAQFTFATPRLAKHYGLKSLGKGLRRYDLSKVPARGGILTQGSALTVGGDSASMVTRGLFMFHDMLRGTVKDPPPSVDTTPVPAKPGLSQRKISESRLANVSCRGCHAKFEPLAFALEKFDGVGGYREKDKFGNLLREDGVLRVPGEAKAKPFKSTAELMNLLAKSPRIQLSITWKATQFAIGRPLGPADVRIVNQIHRNTQRNGGTYRALMTAIASSDLILLKQTRANRNEASE